MTGETPLEGLRVWVAGHSGMVGSALIRALRSRNVELLTVEPNELDLRRQRRVEEWMGDAKPDLVFVAAAKVGGILANSTYPAEFLYDNLMIEANIIHSAFEAKVRKLLFLGSTCIYPRDAENPIREEALLTGPLESTNEWYAVAKIAGIKLCQAYRRQYGADFISAMPTNLYGPHDNFDLASSHVLPAMIRKMHEAKMADEDTVELWGTGRPRRELMHVDDLASALVMLMERYSEDSHINVGTGADTTISELAKLVASATGFEGNIRFDASKPDGTLRKCTDTSRLRALGFVPRIPLAEGIRATYHWFVHHHAAGDQSTNGS